MGDACFALGRDDPDGGDDPPPRGFYAVAVPEWRMAVVCTSDSDQVVPCGSRKAGEAQRWQRWVLPDEEGPPAVPPWRGIAGKDSEFEMNRSMSCERNPDRKEPSSILEARTRP